MASTHNSAPASSAPAGRAFSEGIQLGELAQIVRLRKRLLVFAVTLALIGALLKQVLYIPLYTAETTLSIEKAENSPVQLALANMGNQAFDSSDRLKRYLDYLCSRDFFVAVAETLKYKEGYNLLNLASPDDLGVTKKKFWVQFLNTHFGRHQIRDDAAATREPVLVPIEQLAEILRNMATANVIGNDTIKVGFTSLDSFTSMAVANAIAEVFVAKTGERDYNEVTEVKKFIQEQLESTVDRLKQSESTLIEFKKKHNIVTLSANSEQAGFSKQLGDLEGELQAMRLRQQENQRLIDFYERALARKENRIISQGSASLAASPIEVTNGLRQKLDSLHYKKGLMQAQGYADTSWQMEEINQEVDDTAKTLARLTKDQPAPPAPGEPSGDLEAASNINFDTAYKKLTALKEDNQGIAAKIAAYDRSRDALVKRLEPMSKDAQIVLTLSRDVDLQFELYSSLKKKLQEVEIQQVALQNHVQVSERAGPPGPQPRTSLYVKLLFALLVGLFLGCSGAFLSEAIDPTIKHNHDLERLELSTLASIPHVEGSPIRQTLGLHSYRPDLLICRERPESREAMAFKHIRAQLTAQKGSESSRSRVFVVTSPERGDGKSFIASNLAISLSQLEKRTLLIDCDLRNPSIPWLFGYREGKGLSSLLNLRAPLDEVLLKRRAPCLDILPAGFTPSNPTELISNEKFRVLLEHFKAAYDFIVIDAPPAVAVVDASILASLSDAVILTAAFRKTKRDLMLIALRKILQVSHKQIFGVLNNVWQVDEINSYNYESTGPKQGRELEPVDSTAEMEKFQEILQSRRTGTLS